MLKTTLKDLPQNARVLDYGCYGWTIYNLCHDLGRGDLKHYGCDTEEFSQTPTHAKFLKTNSTDYVIETQDDVFDLIVVTHVIEHVQDPLSFFKSLVRVCKPGGVIYFEAPSDRSIMCKSHPNVEKHGFFSFWDDPTHVRPWTPAAFYRLALSFGCDPFDVGYDGSFMDKLKYPFV